MSTQDQTGLRERKKVSSKKKQSKTNQIQDLKELKTNLLERVGGGLRHVRADS